MEPNNKGNDHEFSHRLQGAWAIKEDQKSTKLKKCVLHAQVRATTYMAIAMLKLKKALEDQSTLQLFTMFEKLIMTPKVCEYSLLCMCEKVENLWHRMGILPISHDVPTIVIDMNTPRLSPPTILQLQLELSPPLTHKHHNQ